MAAAHISPVFTQYLRKGVVCENGWSSKILAFVIQETVESWRARDVYFCAFPSWYYGLSNVHNHHHLPNLGLMFFMLHLTVVANYFHPPDHCSDCEEPEYLCSHDPDCHKLLTVDIADAAEDAFRRCATSSGASA